jgi:hypothetical protein
VKIFLLFICFQVALFGGEEGSLDWNHFFRVDSNLCKFLPDGQGAIVILGAAEESIRGCPIINFRVI